MKHTRGFSLIEVTMVLVILGLLVGAIYVGQNLISNSEIRSAVSDVDRYKMAIVQFKDKYKELPGDFTEAVETWGAAHATPATCQTTASTSKATCDGNGDGFIRVVSTSTDYEMFRAWQHLANAGLIEGFFTGVAGPLNSVNVVPGTNAPALKKKGGGIEVLYNSVPAGDATHFAFKPQHIFDVGRVYSGAGNTLGALFTSQEAYEIDLKIDDGLPHLGDVISWKDGNAATPNCVKSTNDAYDTTVTTGDLCALKFLLGF